MFTVLYARFIYYICTSLYRCINNCTRFLAVSMPSTISNIWENIIVRALKAHQEQQCKTLRYTIQDLGILLQQLQLLLFMVGGVGSIQYLCQYLGSLGDEHAVFIVLVVSHEVDEHNVLVADLIHIDIVAP